MESKFTGRLIALIGINLLTALVSTITLSLAYPAMLCMKQRWIASNTYIDGKQLAFDGTGAQLFGTYLKWILLTIVTIGVYSLWIPIKSQQWVAKHTHFAVSEE